MKPSARVNRVMTASVIWIDVDATVKEVLNVFVECPIHHLPVVKDGAVVGMLSSADIMKLEFFLPRSGPARDRVLSGTFSVAKLMRTPVITVGENESVEHAAELMATHAIHALPVVNRNNKLIGIVTTTDIMAGFLQTEPVLGEAVADGATSSHERLIALEHLAHEARRYLHGGQDERVHAELTKAIERLDRIEEKIGGRPRPILGLDPP